MSLQTSRTKIGGSVFDPWHLFFLLHGRFLASLWAATTSKRRVGHPNEIHFVNPKCVRILCVLAPHNFWVWSISPKTSHFANFRVPMEKKIRVGSILMPLTFHKASLDRYTPRNQKNNPTPNLVSTVWRPGPYKVWWPRFVSPKKGDFEVFFCTIINFLAKQSIFA